jgi:hypothetical protein
MSKALPKGGGALCYVQGYERPAQAGPLPNSNHGSQGVTSDVATNRRQLTGNAGLYYVAWQLSRRGWNVMPTSRNARGSDIFITDGDEQKWLGIQSKALSKRVAVPLGRSLEDLRSELWIITIHAVSETPVCYVMAVDEVKAEASQDKNGGAWWLEPRAYDRAEFKDAWGRIGGALP